MQRISLYFALSSPSYSDDYYSRRHGSISSFFLMIDYIFFFPSPSASLIKNDSFVQDLRAVCAQFPCSAFPHVKSHSPQRLSVCVYNDILFLVRGQRKDCVCLLAFLLFLAQQAKQL